MTLLTHWMLKPPMRQFVIDVVKAPLEKAIILAASFLPEPTHENILRPNTHILLDIRDKFFEYDTNRTKNALFKAAWNLLIAEYDHDPHYRYRLDWFLEMIVNSLWKPRSCGLPDHFWNEPEPYGGGYLVKDEKLMSMVRRFRNLEKLHVSSNAISE